MTYEKAIYWLDEIKRAYIKNSDEDYDRQRKEAIDLAIYYIKEIEKATRRPRGAWKYGIIHSCDDGLRFQWRCSMCGHVEEDTSGINYCPECGADMRSEE